MIKMELLEQWQQTEIWGLGRMIKLKSLLEAIKSSTMYRYYKVIKGKKIIQFKGSKRNARKEMKQAKRKDPKGKYSLIVSQSQKVGDKFND